MKSAKDLTLKIRKIISDLPVFKADDAVMELILVDRDEVRMELLNEVSKYCWHDKLKEMCNDITEKMKI